MLTIVEICQLIEEGEINRSLTLDERMDADDIRAAVDRYVDEIVPDAWPVAE